jgi:hypothetical protein
VNRPGPHVYPTTRLLPAEDVLAKDLVERHYAFVVAPGDADDPTPSEPLPVVKPTPPAGRAC